VDASVTPLEIVAPKPPPRPPGEAKPSNQGVMRWFAARRIFVGTVDVASGKNDSNAWRKIGHDIDGECTTAQMSQDGTSATCQRAQGSPADTLADGDDCRDNAYGRILAVGTQSLASGWELQFQSDVQNGRPTLLLRLSDLDEGSDDPYVPGAVYLSVQTETAPKWDGNDVFQVQRATVSGPSITDAPLIAFPKGYLAGDVWVSGERGTGTSLFPVLLIDKLLLSTVMGSVVVAALDTTHEHVLGSAMSGVADESAVANEWALYFLDAINCKQYLVDLLMNQFVLPSLDVAPAPPSFQNAGEVCSALSIGTAYEWVPIRAPSEVVDTGPPFTACDGG